MISTLAWAQWARGRVPAEVQRVELSTLLNQWLARIPRGAPKRVAERFELSATELQAAREAAAAELEQSKGGAPGATAGAAAGKPADDFSDLPPELKMDEYDNSDEDDVGEDGIANMFYKPEEQDPYLGRNAGDEDSVPSEAEDYTASATDAFLMVGSTEDDYSTLEVHVFDEGAANLFVHHDITLPSFPLALAWMDCPPAAGNVDTVGVGSYCAVGTFKPSIEIWNLDVMDVFEPVAILGGEAAEANGAAAATAAKGKKGKKKGVSKETLLPGSHRSAVMSLHWNREHRHLLASGSADNTVKMWDVTTTQCLHTFTHHKNKVQSVRWNPVETSVMLSGSFDRTAAVWDAKSPTAVASFAASADIESATWNFHNPAQFLISCEDGHVYCYDVRHNTTPVFTLKAHDKAASTVSVNPLVPGLIATSSVDKTVKLWDISAAPELIGAKNMAVGELFACEWYPYSPWLLACGGSKGTVAVWDTADGTTVERRFKSRALDPLAVPYLAVRPRADGQSIPVTDPEEAAAAAAGAAAEDAAADTPAAGVAEAAAEDVDASMSGAAAGAAAGAGASQKKKDKKKKNKH